MAAQGIPPEIWAKIFTLTMQDRRSVLHSLALTCALFAGIVQPLLFKKQTSEYEGSRSDVLNMMQRLSFWTNPQISVAIQSCTLDFFRDSEEAVELQDKFLKVALPHLVALQELRLGCLHLNDDRLAALCGGIPYRLKILSLDGCRITATKAPSTLLSVWRLSVSTQHLDVQQPGLEWTHIVDIETLAELSLSLRGPDDVATHLSEVQTTQFPALTSLIVLQAPVFEDPSPLLNHILSRSPKLVSLRLNVPSSTFLWGGFSDIAPASTPHAHGSSKLPILLRGNLLRIVSMQLNTLETILQGPTRTDHLGNISLAFEDMDMQTWRKMCEHLPRIQIVEISLIRYSYRGPSPSTVTDHDCISDLISSTPPSVTTFSLNIRKHIERRHDTNSGKLIIAIICPVQPTETWFRQTVATLRGERPSLRGIYLRRSNEHALLWMKQNAATQKQDLFIVDEPMRAASVWELFIDSLGD